MAAGTTEEQKDQAEEKDAKSSTSTPAPASEDPRVVAARVELELAKIAREKERLGLTDQSERAKLLKELVPDFESVTVEKDTTSSSDKPSALAESMIQQTVLHVVDDIADDIMQAVNALPAKNGSPPVTCFFVTSDVSHREDLAAHRDVEARLKRLDDTLTRLCPEQPTSEQPTSTDRLDAAIAGALIPPAAAVLSALPGAITMATRLLAHQYTTSSYTSTGHAGVDLRTAGALVSRIGAVPGTTVFVRRVQSAPDDELRIRLLALAASIDDRLAEHRGRAHVAAALANAEVEQYQARRAQVSARVSDLFAAWKDKVGKSAGTAGLQDDLALVTALDDAIAKGDPGDPETKRLVSVREVVTKRIAAVLEEIAKGTGEIGTPQLLDMVKDLEAEDRTLAGLLVTARREKAEADERAGELDALHTAATEFIESLGTADGSGERLFDKACNGALITQDGTVVVYVRLLHAGADGVDVTRVGPDHRNTMHGASLEWALVRGGTTVDAGVRTQIGYHRVNLSQPHKATSGILAGASKPRVTLAARTSDPG